MKLQELSTDERRQVTRTVVLGFLRVADIWKLSREDCLHLTGIPDEEGFELVTRKADAGEAFDLGDDAIYRMVGVVWVHNGLEQMFYTPQAQTDWLSSDRAEPPFEGQSPLSLMISGLPGVEDTSDFLERQTTG